MPNRTAITAAAAVTASLLSGGLAFAATVSSPAAPVAADVRTAAATDAPGAGGPTAPADDLATAWFAGVQSGATTAAGATRAGSDRAAAWFAGLTAQSGASAFRVATDDPDSPEATHPPKRHDPTPTTTAAPPATNPPVTNPPTTPTTTPAPWNCRGSDDGLTETQKQAREAYCHSIEQDG
jgi:hypothetical protein